MATEGLKDVVAYLRRVSAKESACKLHDRELLERFVTHHDEAAFQTLLARHGPMVLNVCRRVLYDSHAAEDAFQATFLVLIRKAAWNGGVPLWDTWQIQGLISEGRRRLSSD